jgi:hypothetical protein
MSNEQNLIVKEIHEYVDELAASGQNALNVFVELAYYAREEDVLALLRNFIFMSPAEKQLLLAAANRLCKMKFATGQDC